MANGKLKPVLQGISLTAIYALAFVVTWHMSLDQWYLPAGLRFAALFLLPPRLVPYALAGDALALLYIRVPLANQDPGDEFPVLWAWISPFLLAASLWGGAALIRRVLDVRDLTRTFAFAALVYAVVAKALNVAVNMALSGPGFGTSVQQFFSSVIGDYLGILLMVLPWAVWRQRVQWYAPAITVIRDVAIAAALVSCLYAVVFATDAQGTVIQLLPLMFMTLPAVYLAVVYGWNGAAVGSVIVNLGIALALPRTNILGAFDGVVLLAQCALSVASFVLLSVGSHITRLSRQFHSTFAELENQREASRSLARSTFTTVENRLRQNAMMLAAARALFDGYRHEVVSTLKAGGQHGAAFDATLKGRAAIDEIKNYGDELYPFDIENYGLYAVLMSDRFANRFGPQVSIRNVLLGESPRLLSVSQRLAVYRGITAAMDTLHAQCQPTEIHAKVRIWKRKRLTGTTVEVRCKGHHRGAIARVPDLDATVTAYGGRVKYRHTRGVAFVVCDDELSAAELFPAVPVNAQPQPAG